VDIVYQTWFIAQKMTRVDEAQVSTHFRADRFYSRNDFFYGQLRVIAESSGVTYIRKLLELNNMRLSPRSVSASCLGAAAVCAFSLAALTGCAGNFASTASPATTTGFAIRGSAHGGQQPLSGANVYFFAAGNTGYASAATSLLIPGRSGVLTDSNGRGYVTTDSGGGWSISSDYVCNPTDQVYVLVTGGNPGLPGTVNNTGIAMMNALGSCSSINSSTFVIVNELSTVAAAEALQQFMTDGMHLGSSPTNSLGIQNAFLTVRNIVGIGETQARTLTPAGNGTVPQATLHTLANALAACVNTFSSASTTCGSLFASAPYHSAPATDTLVAALSIAQNPAYKPNTIYNLSTSNPPFLPALSQAPKDFSIGINYALGGVPEPGSMAIDAAGNVWVTNRASEKAPFQTGDSIVKLSPQGAVLSGASGFTAGGIFLPEGIAVDLDGSSLWVANTPGSVVKMTSNGTLAPGFPAAVGSYPQGIAIDTGGNAWVSNNQSNDIYAVAATGTILHSGITAANFSSLQGVAIDYNAFIYVVGEGSSSILKLAANGTVANAAPGFTGAGLNAPSGIAIDNSSRLWAANTNFSFTTGQQSGPSSLSVLTNSGTAVSGSNGYGNATAGVANILSIDGNGSAWTALCTSQCIGGSVPDSVMEISSTGTVLSPAGGFQNDSFASPQAVAIDSSGNVWVANSGGQSNSTPGSVTELVGLAGPVRTPTVAQLTGNNLLGAKP
jgi:hypothetical protein